MAIEHFLAVFVELVLVGKDLCRSIEEHQLEWL